MKRKKKKMKKKVKILLFFLLLLLIVFLLWNSTKIVLKKEVSVSLNEEAKVENLLKNVRRGTVLNKEEALDTSTIGEKEVKILFKTFLGFQKTYKVTYQVVDNESPVIHFQKTLTTAIGKEIDLLKDVSASDNSRETVSVFVEGEYDFNKIGDYTLYYVCKDRSGNEAREEFILKVGDGNTSISSNESTFTTSKGFEGVVKDGVTYIDGTLIVNKSYSLPSTFGNGLTTETTNAFNKMKSAALLDGLNIYIASGWRSYDRQVTLYNNYVKRDGKEAADTYSARPGYSEHQSGLTFDVNEVSDKFIGTPEANWLSENCYKYGFILRYPNGKQDITGFKYEAWHFRYVGVDLATKLYNNGDWLCLEEYFGIDSVYKD